MVTESNILMGSSQQVGNCGIVEVVEHHMMRDVCCGKDVARLVVTRLSAGPDEGG